MNHFDSPRWQSTTFTGLCFLAIVATLHCFAGAFPHFKERIPNGDAYTRWDSGITCERLGHIDCIPGAPRNPFGLDFKAAGLLWTKELCKKDSDGDGLTNGQELGDPCCEWSAENKTPLRLTQLSHLGRSWENGAMDAPGCFPPPLPPADPPVFPPQLSSEVLPPTQLPASDDMEHSTPAATIEAIEETIEVDLEVSPSIEL